MSASTLSIGEMALTTRRSSPAALRLQAVDFGPARILARTAAAMTGFGLKEPNRAELTQGSKTVSGR